MARIIDAQAYRFYAESLALRRELGVQAGIAACLEGIATVAEISGRSQQAARLLGAAQALRDAIGASLSPIDVPSYEQVTATVRASLGERAFASTWVEGQTMSLEQVVTYALERGRWLVLNHIYHPLRWYDSVDAWLVRIAGPQ